MHAVWDVLEFIANTLVFFYFGVLISVRIYEGHQTSVDDETRATGSEADITAAEEQTLFARDWGYAVLNWLLLLVIRLITLAFVKPVLARVGDGFSWKDVLLGTWAGLRGAVGLSLALIVDLASSQPGSTIDSRYATIIVFFAGTMSVLTILVQGTTMPMLLNLLGVTRKTPVQVRWRPRLLLFLFHLAGAVCCSAHGRAVYNVAHM
jgi:NhaP-type Na+/H+ or K+/H+ antiporter